MPRLKVIVNPTAGRGYGARVSRAIAEHLHALGADFGLVHTAYAGQAIQLAQQAVEQGYDIVVAVGGDGTAHEVVNGMMAAHNGAGEQMKPALACIPAGNGNDFATMNGASHDVQAACEMIVRGVTHPVDVGRVTLDGAITRYFSNAVGIGFDALVTMETYRHRHLRGMALYIPVVLKTIFQTMQPTRLEILCDQQEIHRTTLATIIANGPREGGSFLVAPAARCDDGLLDLMMADDMSRLSMLAMVPRFMRGTHVKHRLVSIRQARRIVISSVDPLYTHVDGEVLTPDPVHHVEIQVIPGCLRMIVPEGHCKRG